MLLCSFYVPHVLHTYVPHVSQTHVPHVSQTFFVPLVLHTSVPHVSHTHVPLVSHTYVPQDSPTPVPVAYILCASYVPASPMHVPFAVAFAACIHRGTHGREL